MRSVRSAICTSGEPVSPSCLACLAMMVSLASLVIAMSVHLPRGSIREPSRGLATRDRESGRARVAQRAAARNRARARGGRGQPSARRRGRPRRAPGRRGRPRRRCRARICATSASTVVEAPLVADLVQEVEPDLTVVDVPREVEQKRLDGHVRRRLVAALEGRVVADVDGGAVPGAVHEARAPRTRRGPGRSCRPRRRRWRSARPACGRACRRARRRRRPTAAGRGSRAPPRARRRAAAGGCAWS